jgi:hypothetical protein
VRSTPQANKSKQNHLVVLFAFVGLKTASPFFAAQLILLLLLTKSKPCLKLNYKRQGNNGRIKPR